MIESAATAQKPWIGRLFKVVGAVLLVLSLISGTRSLTALWTEYRDKQTAVSSSLQAARLMAETDEFELAWQQLDFAAHSTSETGILEHRIAISMPWIRWLGGESVDQTTYRDTTERVLPVLYRGLSESGDWQVADIRAHIAWASYLQSLVAATKVDVVTLLEQAIAQFPENLYANTMLGFLIAQRQGAESFQDVQTYFAQARSEGDTEWAKQLQLNTIEGLLSDTLTGGPPKKALAIPIARYYLKIAGDSSRVDQLGRSFTDFLFSISNDDRAGTVEQLVGSLEPNRYLELLKATYRNRGVSLTTRYLFARLEEERGHLEEASEHLSMLEEYKGGIPDSLLGKIQSMQLRLGRANAAEGESPGNTAAGGEPDAIETWQAHANALFGMNADFILDDVSDAIAFFDEIPGKAVTPDMRSRILESRNRIKTYVDEGERWLLESGGSEDTESQLIVPRWNLAAVWYLVGRLALVSGNLDAAIAEWSDLYPRLPKDITLAKELSLAYGQRAVSQPGGDSLRGRDQEQALYYLREYVARLRSRNESVPWEDIIAEPAYAAIRRHDAFENLVRGRQ